MSRTGRPADEVATAADLLAIAGPVRSAVQTRLQAAGVSAEVVETEDVVQETLARVWEVRWRLERETLLSYSLVVARNLVTTAERQEALRARHGSRLIEPATAPGPEDGLLAAEEHSALMRALAAMRAADRSLLIEHEVRGVGTGKIAAEEGVAANTVAVRLARARARLRVDHLLELRRITLPTAACRGILEAISLGDRGRQRRLLAAEHLAHCIACAGLAEPLLTRRRALTGLTPVAVVLAAPGRVWAWVRAHPISASAASAATAGVAVAVGILLTGAGPAPRAAAAPPPAGASPTATAAAVPAPPATLSVGGIRLLPSSRVASMRPDVGQKAVARGVPVESVPADEGFWVGAAPGRRVWVQLQSRGESPVHVRAGQRLSFTGTVTRVPAGMPVKVGLTAAEGAAELTTEGAYVLVSPGQLTVD